ncbi:hypothetical protein [Pelagicoccus sp. SDUM812003]|uniref:hypothetical protein n=1 Tax=Pelagicoccus sp. SDUM812003 TaxID=3041267 RepID=UPI00280FBDDA|nr:hypothetical protein [Pelagicoccus sp. SDUM812003]MDQ8204000.1 hypothetical protein [Pelagicoccus sp. SDUM812003]
MNSNQDQTFTLDLSLIRFAINAARSAQAAYGRAYFEWRDESSIQIETIAQLRLCHSRMQQTLEARLIEAEQKLPEPDEQTGPFADDPRATLFGIEQQLAFDYLKESDLKLADFYLEKANALGLGKSYLENWIQDMDKAHQRLEKRAAPRKEKPSDDGPSRVAACS